MRRVSTTLLRFPLLILAMAGLVSGLWGGLFRAGTALPLPSPVLPGMHGPIMIGGFLGTLISLERAVALGKVWGYVAPLAAAVGGIIIIAYPSSVAGPIVMTGASAMLCAVFIRIYSIQPANFLRVMMLGAAAWFGGNVLWAMQLPVSIVVWWWVMFLVLTIAGERLELSRMLDHDPRVLRPFGALVLGGCAALLVLPAAPDVGVRLAGIALAGLGLWMLIFDVARYTIRTMSLARYIASCLLMGYVWLIAAGLIALMNGYVMAGPVYDSMLHAVFVGFVFSMIFGHAPVIFPSVLGLQVGYTPWLYLHLGILHAGLLIRVAGNLTGWLPGRVIGSWASAVAIVFFLMTMVATLVRTRAVDRREHNVIAG